MTLAYRDDDRTPVIFAMREAASRHYDIDVRVDKIKDGDEFEAALFTGAADVLIEHLEFLYGQAAQGKKVVFFCALGKGGGLDLVVPRNIQGSDELRAKTLAVRSHGQPHAVTPWFRMMGLESVVKSVLVHDREVGRSGQWKKVASGECAAAFMSPLYLPEALNGRLKVLAVPEIPIIGHFAQACLSEFTAAHPAVMTTYAKAAVRALIWLSSRPGKACATLGAELKRAIKLDDESELRQRFDAVVSGLKIRPYPTPQATISTYEIATSEYPGAKGLNPLRLWDLHWVKELDDAAFIDGLSNRLRG